jgi:hypothetical protein
MLDVLKHFSKVSENGAQSVMGYTRYMNTNEVTSDLGRSGRGNWVSSTLVKLR